MECRGPFPRIDAPGKALSIVFGKTDENYTGAVR